MMLFSQMFILILGIIKDTQMILNNTNFSSDSIVLIHHDFVYNLRTILKL